MNEPRTLQEYIDLRNFQRRRQNCLINEAKNIPNPLSLDKEKKLDSMMMEILEYIQHIIGKGPLFNRFRIMMQNLYRTFQRELTEFHNIGVVNKFRTEQKYLEDIKQANLKLNEYLEKCKEDTKNTQEKLQKLQKTNKELNTNMLIINKNAPKNIEDDDFGNEEVVERTGKVGKVTKIEINDNSKKKDTEKPTMLLIPGKTANIKEPSNGLLKTPQSPEMVGKKSIARISNFFTQV